MSQMGRLVSPNGGA